MKTSDWNNKFGEAFLITLTDEERRHLALSPIASHWENVTFYSRTNLWYTRVTAFFDGDVIIKVISEQKRVLSTGITNFESYVEYDTTLSTKDRMQLLPLTARGRPKPLSASNITAVSPFGCLFCIEFKLGKDTFLCLNNPRANKAFPIGEENIVSAIRSDAEFHAFMEYYITTCREDYFSKLHTFITAKKVTVKYKAGDIFRMELDRTHYCYGIITGDVKKILSIPELPQNHSLRKLMMVPIMIRPYALITEDPDLKAEGLRHISLGRVQICGDNDIIWGTHTIVDHKELAPSDLEFHFVCTKLLSRSPHATLFTQDMLMKDGLLPKEEYTLYIEWGFTQTVLPYDSLSDKLKAFLEDYSSPHGGVALGIDPRSAVPDEKMQQAWYYRKNLLNPENREMLQEIFLCLGLGVETTFDQFAKAFGGLTLEEIATRMK